MLALSLGFAEQWREREVAGKEEIPVATPSPPLEAEAALALFKERSPAIIAAYLRDEPVRRLQIGAGTSRRGGWLNTDIEPANGLAFLDASKPFPLEDGTFHYVASEHVIEHLTYDEGKVMLAESFRVLAPGGTVRIATPDLGVLIDLFKENKSKEAQRYLADKVKQYRWPSDPKPETIILNLQMSSWGHKFLYDAETLMAALTRAGFVSAKKYTVGKSDDPALEGMEARVDGHFGHVNDYETMAIQATKPPR